MTAAPKRIQRQRTKGWRMPEGAVYVGRPSKWGNPFVVGSWVSMSGRQFDGFWFDCAEIPMTADMAVAAFRGLMAGRMTLEPDDMPEDAAYHQSWRDAVASLRGHDLVCWCPLDSPCHADVLLEIANRR